MSTLSELFFFSHSSKTCCLHRTLFTSDSRPSCSEVHDVWYNCKYLQNGTR